MIKIKKHINYLNKKIAFTLIELIVVITIMAILWTISYIWVKDYSKDARNSARVTQIQIVNKALHYYYLKVWKYPDPDNYVEIKYEWTTIWKQWVIWDTVLRKLNSIIWTPIDPLYSKKYTYSVSNDNKHYQVAGVVEN